MEKTLKTLDAIATIAVSIFVIFVLFAFGVEVQKRLLGVTAVETRVKLLEEENERKQKLISKTVEELDKIDEKYSDSEN